MAIVTRKMDRSNRLVPSLHWPKVELWPVVVVVIIQPMATCLDYKRAFLEYAHWQGVYLREPCLSLDSRREFKS